MARSPEWPKGVWPTSCPRTRHSVSSSLRPSARATVRPICAPSRGPWGIKAFTEYLGDDRGAWARYDANELLKGATARTPVLIDQGTEDEFLERELFTDVLERTVRETGYPATIRRQEGYDHSYFFVSTFMDDHLAFHARNLKS